LKKSFSHLLQFETVVWQQESNTITVAKTWLLIANKLMMAVNWRHAVAKQSID
jgi:hypothetical protein